MLHESGQSLCQPEQSSRVDDLLETFEGLQERPCVRSKLVYDALLEGKSIRHNLAVSLVTVPRERQDFLAPVLLARMTSEPAPLLPLMSVWA